MYAYAASQAHNQAQNLLSKINEAILFPLITLMMAIALLIFLYGAFEYVRAADSEGGRETGRRHLLWGTIGMLVMISALSILTIAAGTFDLTNELDDAMSNGASNDWLSIWSDDELGSSYDDRGPSEASYGTVADADDSDDDSTDTVDSSVDGDTTPPADANGSSLEDDPFSDGIDPIFYGFYEDEINAAQQSGTISIEEIVGYFFLPNGEFPDNYLLYETTDLLPWCHVRGGEDVFSISINNDTARQFYCVKNL